MPITTTTNTKAAEESVTTVTVTEPIIEVETGLFNATVGPKGEVVGTISADGSIDGWPDSWGENGFVRCKEGQDG